MNIALTNIHAAASARSHGRQGFVRALVFGCAVACASVPAFAGPDRDRDAPRNPPQQQAPPANREQPASPQPRERAPHQQQQQQQPQAQPQQHQNEGHGYDSRADDQHRQAQQQQDQGTRRPGRLTPDERRELRRQINEAGIDLYPNAPRR